MHFSNIDVPGVPFRYYSLCILFVYKVSGEEMDLSVITAKPHGKALEQQNRLIQLLIQ